MGNDYKVACDGSVVRAAFIHMNTVSRVSRVTYTHADLVLIWYNILFFDPLPLSMRPPDRCLRWKISFRILMFNFAELLFLNFQIFDSAPLILFIPVRKLFRLNLGTITPPLPMSRKVWKKVKDEQFYSSLNLNKKNT